jgi:hypothetical protein
MSEANPAAPHHLPIFITEPGQPDMLFNVMAIFLVVAVLLVAVFYFKLHSLPERIAHKGQKIQFEIVAVLGLISLFTHNHFFWIAGLLLAFIPIPDFSTPLERMADSLGRMAGWRKPSPGTDAVLPQGVAIPTTAIGVVAKDERQASVTVEAPAASLGLTDPAPARVAAADEIAPRLRTPSKESA